ncbi:hypothetical protein D9C73_016597 [Collichthys lucidus]|uniref:Apolipoprotein M n=1 Tax=Collichthys lucidus TaxID=240159 RepID=A0A4U5V4P7_COLLU|nr:hypothetical protein D9C73_016597 [Collichthys lucidus]
MKRLGLKPRQQRRESGLQWKCQTDESFICTEGAGKAERRNLLWSGKWANCPECIIFQEIEPPLKPTDTVDSIDRFMLYARKSDVDSEVVTTFLKNAACHNKLATVQPPQEKVTIMNGWHMGGVTSRFPKKDEEDKEEVHRLTPVCQTSVSNLNGEKQHFEQNLDTEIAAHTGMEGQSRCSHKYLLLQVWCGLLTVAMVVMAAFLTSIKPKSPQDLRSHTSSSAGGSDRCQSCALRLENNSVRCNKDGLYFFYAQVEFSNNPEKKNQSKSVTFKRDASHGISMRILVDASFPNTRVGSVWVAKVVSFRDGDSGNRNVLVCVSRNKFLPETRYKEKRVEEKALLLQTAVFSGKALMRPTVRYLGRHNNHDNWCKHNFWSTSF